MADARGSSLAQIADLLESRSLTDPEILDAQSWREVVLPKTRPFLERIRSAVGTQKVNLFQGKTVTTKRTCFDALKIAIRPADASTFDAFVNVGLADLPGGKLERSLSWGLFAWGKAAPMLDVKERLNSLREYGFEAKTLPGGQADAFAGGTTVILHRALSPDELRNQDEDKVIEGIVRDLERLMERVGEDTPDRDDGRLKPRDERLSAATLAEWLRSARGLIFTPYQVAALVTALQAKGFVILSGLSGTGKTQLAVQIAELVLGKSPSVIPVRPDWRDSRSLLGYYNPISERYASTELLRQLLPEQEISPPASIGTGFDPQRVREVVTAEPQMGWIGELRVVVERFESADPAELSASDLHTIWRESSNGVASIGQAISHKLRGDEDELREATKLLAAPGTPGKRLIDALHYLHGLGNPWHWARALRALAVFDLDRTSTVADRYALGTVLASLGYERSFRLDRWVQAKDAASIDAAFDFLRQRIDELFRDLDRFQKAVAPWLIYEQVKGIEQPTSARLEQAVAPPRFVILDEMNLARVEYYFAEFLSVLESDRDEAGITTQALPLHSERGAVRDGPEDDPSANDIPAELVLPPYLYIVGTVNTDETTHAFSPKVLDRAFTIEFNDIELEQTGRVALAEGRPKMADDLARLLTASSPETGREAMVRAIAAPRFLKWLGTLYDRLRPYDLHFGFRTRDEIARFVGYAAVSPLRDGFGGSDEDAFVGAFDAAVLMKVLPKFHGPRTKLSAPLTCVLSWAISPDDPDEAEKRIASAIGSAAETTSKALLGSALPAEKPEAVLPRVADKAARMLYEVTTVGFTTFS